MTQDGHGGAELLPENRDKLEMHRSLKQTSSASLTIPPRAVHSPCPLSFAQQRLWFLEQLDPNSATYNIVRAWRLSGEVNQEALGAAINSVVSRHEALRTNFVSIDGIPIQQIHPNQQVSLRTTDLGSLPAAERQGESLRLATEEGKTPFNLSQDAMLRARLIHLDEEEHVLVLTMHHIASDGWSEWVLWKELAELYEAHSKGLAPRLADLPIQYADYAIWQREWLRGEALESQLAYWKKRLGTDLPMINLPLDQPRPAVLTQRGSRQSVVLPLELAQQLRAFSRRERATLFMTMLAAFQVLLYRYTGQEDIVVGSPIANRGWAEVEGLVGFFVNTLVLRTDLSGGPAFRELLQRVKEVSLEAYSRQDLPFEKLVEELQPPRSLDHDPLFQVGFGLQNAPAEPLQLTGLEVTPLKIHSETAKYDLSMMIAETENGLQAGVEFKTDLFDAAIIRRMLGHYRTLLESIVADPDECIWRLPLLTYPERRHLLEDLNGASIPYPHDRCVHELFEQQVERTPEATAISFEDTSMSYHELDCRANQLAHYLRDLGVGLEALIGIFMDRSPEMVIAMLGILKAGGAYVPLETESPKGRLLRILEDAQPSVVLTNQRIIDRLPAQTANAVCLDRAWEDIAMGSDKRPASGAGPENLAYVLYTSGSTGMPKGVMVQHRSLQNLLAWWNKNLMAGNSIKVMPAHITLSFDPSLTQIFTPLLRGSEVWLLPPGIALDPVRFLEVLGERTQVGLNCVPSVWERMLDAIESGRVQAPAASLKYLFLGGEEVSSTIVLRSLNAFPQLIIGNLYGPTETTALTTYASHLSPESVTIGKPIANTKIYILDRHLQPLPAGVPGELHVGGESLARGYLRDPKLTAEKFIPDPFSQEPGARLYKTGDLVRFLPDGNIQFLGRMDDQVKIRGIRIEPGEIAAVLREHPQVREVVVLARDENEGQKQLVAYVVPKQQQALTVSELRNYLAGMLPAHMAPSAYILMTTLPLLANGKVNRHALPPPGKSRPDLAESYVAPRTPVEITLTEIWRELLELDEVGVEDNFFDLSGHSLTAVQVVSRVRDIFGLEMPVRCLFESPTVAGLALVVERMGGESEPE